VRLENGLQVAVVARRDLPLLSAYLVLRGGRSVEPEGLTGVAQFAANLLSRGTETRSAQEVARAIEEIGGELSGQANQDALTISASALSEYADVIFALLGDVALHPTFPEHELDTYRQRALTGLRAELANPGTVAARAFDAIVYGPHPYGNVNTERSLNAISRDDVAAYYASQLDPADAYLVVIGDIDPEEAVRLAEATFGGWSAASAMVDPAFPVPPRRAERRVYLVDRPGSTQAEIRVGHLGLAGRDPARFPLAVANQVLGAGPASRLFQNLRERQGFAYDVFSAYTLPRDRGRFVVNAAVRPDVVEPAVRAILGEMERLREGAPAEELETAKAYLIGSYGLRLETNSSIAGQLISFKVRELPVGLLSTYQQTIAEMDGPAVRRAAEEHLRPDEVAIVVVGDASRLREALARIAPVTLVNAEGRVVE
jgi:zinc protease